MSGNASLDKKVTSFVFGLVAAFGYTHARKFVARRYGEDSQILRFLDEQFPQLARQVHDHLIAGQPSTQPVLTHDRADYLAGQAAYQKQDWNAAYLAFLKADEAGDLDAPNYLGLIYWKDRINMEKQVPDIHFRLAIGMFEKAIAGGDTIHAPVNLTALGYDYDNGVGVPKDEIKGHGCYETAARAGNPQAMFNLAYNYRAGCGTAKDMQAARHWFGRVAACTDTERSRELAAKAARMLSDMDSEEHGGRSYGSGVMSRACALEIIEMQEGASNAEMKAAWVRLVQINHPDKGGSTYFMKQLNEAREVLGF